MISTGVCKLDFYYRKIKNTYITSIMNAMLVPTDFHLKKNCVILVRLTDKKPWRHNFILLYKIKLFYNGLKVNLLIHTVPRDVLSCGELS